MIQDWQTKPDSYWNSECENVMESVVTARYPALLDLAAMTKSIGSVRMSGSGSTFFVALKDKQLAPLALDQAKIKLRSAGYQVIETATSYRSKLHVQLEHS